MPLTHPEMDENLENLNEGVESKLPISGGQLTGPLTVLDRPATDNTDNAANTRHVQSAILIEQNRAIAEEQRIVGLLNTERATSISEKDQLTYLINQESNRAQMAEAIEENTRIGNFSVLDVRITQEVTDRKAAVTAEINARTAADNAVRTDAATDATAKANNAITVAAFDATTKASAAQANAINASAPLEHVGASAGAHPLAIANGASGFISGADQAKLNTVAPNANNYVLPIASGSVLGGIKAGTNVTIDSNGVLSVSSNISANSSTATKLATPRIIAINGDSSGSVSFDGSQDVSISTVLANSGVVAGNYTKVSVDVKGRVTAGTVLVLGDIPDLSTLYQPRNTELNKISAITGSNGFLRKNLAGDYVFDGSTYLTANQQINLTGDATGSGTVSVSVTLANTGVVAGTYNTATQVAPITVDSKGRLTTVGAAVTITPAWGSVSGKPTTIAGYGITDALVKNANIAASTGTKISYDAKGLVTGSLPLTPEDIPDLDASKITTGTINASVNGNATTASKLEFSRMLGVSGDATGSVSFDGSQSVNIPLVLANTAVVSGTYGNATTAPTVIVDSKGRITGISNNLITPAWGSVTGKPTTVSAFTNDSGYQTLAQVDAKINALIGGAPTTLDTLNEIAVRLQSNESLDAALTNTVALKADKTYVDAQITATKAGNVATANKVLDADQPNITSLGVLPFINVSSYVYKSGGTAPAYYMSQDGTGRQHWYWNTSGGAAPVFAVANEGAGDIMHHADNLGGEYFHYRAASGAGKNAGDPIVFESVLYATRAGVFTFKNNNVWHAGNLSNLGQLANTPGYISGNQAITLSGDITGNGTTSISAVLNNTGIAAGTYTKITVDAKGRATAGTSLVAGDIPTLNQNTTGLSANITGICVPANGGTGVTGLTGIPYGNGTNAFTVATAAQIVAAIGATAVSVATTANAVAWTNVSGRPTAVSSFTNDAGYLIGSAVHFIGTTSIALNRASAIQTLTGVNIDGSAGTANALNAANNYTVNKITATVDITAGDAYVNGHFRNNTASCGMYSQAHTTHFYPDSGNYWNATVGTAGGIRLRNGHGGTVLGYFYSDSGSTGFLNAAGAWSFRNISDHPSYGGATIAGSKGAYTGIYMSYSASAIIGMFDNVGNGGSYDSSGWHHYWHKANACLGIGGATTFAGYKGCTNGSHYVMGDLYATGNVTAYSDERKKENLIQIPNALEIVNKLTGFYYNKIDDPFKRREMGVSAQQTLPHAPEVVFENLQGDLSVAYGNLAALFIESIKTLTLENQQMRAEINQLKSKGI